LRRPTGRLISRQPQTAWADAVAGAFSSVILHLLGLGPFNFRFPYQGLPQRLIGVEDDAKVRKELLA
jgi:hypothetical protein